MSYFVRFEVGWDGGEAIDLFSKPGKRKTLAHVEQYLRKQKAEGRDERLDWLDEFGEAFDGRAAIKLLDQVEVANLLLYVSARLPVTTFLSREGGEDLNDAWILEVADGEVQWARNMNEERPGFPRVIDPRPPKAKPTRLAKSIIEPDLVKSMLEALADQVSAPEVVALVLKRRGDFKPRALVYIGPLNREGYEQVKRQVVPAYRTQLDRDPRSLLSYPVTTAEKPQGEAG